MAIASSAARLCGLLIPLLVAPLTLDARGSSGESAMTLGSRRPDDPHVRIDGMLIPFADRLAARSPTFRHLLRTLAQSDVVVHIRPANTLPGGVGGWMTFLTTAGGHRHLIVQIRSPLSRAHLATTLGHELWHAVEVAGNPSVIDADSFTLEYSKIGFLLRNGPPAIFETDAAVKMGERVRAEFVGADDD